MRPAGPGFLLLAGKVRIQAQPAPMRAARFCVYARVSVVDPIYPIFMPATFATALDQSIFKRRSMH
jgi:hypothetical protein